MAAFVVGVNAEGENGRAHVSGYQSRPVRKDRPTQDFSVGASFRARRGPPFAVSDSMRTAITLWLLLGTAVLAQNPAPARTSGGKPAAQKPVAEKPAPATGA